MAARICLVRAVEGNVKTIACQTLPTTFCRRKHSSLANIRESSVQQRICLHRIVGQPFCTVQSTSTSKTKRSPTDDETKSGKSNEEKTKASKQRLKKYLFGGFAVWASAVSVGLVSQWGKPPEDFEGKPIEDEYSKYNVVLAYILRTYKEIFFQVKVTKEPSREKLLPDPLTYPYIQPPYTLVIEYKDVLVHPEWSYRTGWRFKKRPGIDYFLRTVGPPMFEVVIFTKDSGMTADPIITKIDPENFIMYRLYRDATRYQDGEHIKDLNCLNRDLSKVIMIDWNREAYRLTPDNGLKIAQWTGEMRDTTLGELAEFLRAIAVSKVDDVRPVLRYYNEFDKPLEKFHENQRKLKEEQDRQMQAQQERGRKSLTGLWASLKR